MYFFNNMSHKRIHHKSLPDFETVYAGRRVRRRNSDSNYVKKMVENFEKIMIDSAVSPDKRSVRSKINGYNLLNGEKSSNCQISNSICKYDSKTKIDSNTERSNHCGVRSNSLKLRFDDNVCKNNLSTKDFQCSGDSFYEQVFDNLISPVSPNVNITDKLHSGPCESGNSIQEDEINNYKVFTNNNRQYLDNLYDSPYIETHFDTMETNSSEQPSESAADRNIIKKQYLRLNSEERRKLLAGEAKASKKMQYENYVEKRRQQIQQKINFDLEQEVNRRIEKKKGYKNVEDSIVKRKMGREYTGGRDLKLEGNQNSLDSPDLPNVSLNQEVVQIFLTQLKDSDTTIQSEEPTVIDSKKKVQPVIKPDSNKPVVQNEMEKYVVKSSNLPITSKAELVCVKNRSKSETRLGSLDRCIPNVERRRSARSGNSFINRRVQVYEQNIYNDDNGYTRSDIMIGQKCILQNRVRSKKYRNNENDGRDKRLEKTIGDKKKYFETNVVGDDSERSKGSSRVEPNVTTEKNSEEQSELGKGLNENCFKPNVRIENNSAGRSEVEGVKEKNFAQNVATEISSPRGILRVDSLNTNYYKSIVIPRMKSGRQSKRLEIDQKEKHFEQPKENSSGTLSKGFETDQNKKYFEEKSIVIPRNTSGIQSKRLEIDKKEKHFEQPKENSFGTLSKGFETDQNKKYFEGQSKRVDDEHIYQNIIPEKLRTQLEKSGVCLNGNNYIYHGEINGIKSKEDLIKLIENTKDILETRDNPESQNENQPKRLYKKHSEDIKSRRQSTPHKADMKKNESKSLEEIISDFNSSDVTDEEIMVYHLDATIKDESTEIILHPPNHSKNDSCDSAYYSGNNVLSNLGNDEDIKYVIYVDENPEPKTSNDFGFDESNRTVIEASNYKLIVENLQYPDDSPGEQSDEIKKYRISRILLDEDNNPMIRTESIANNLNDLDTEKNVDKHFDLNEEPGVGDDSGSDSVFEDEPQFNMTKKMKLIIQELIETEENYIHILKTIITEYLPEMEKVSIPFELMGKGEIIFGNIVELYNELTNRFLPELKKCKDVRDIAQLFLSQKYLLKLYIEYNRNKINSQRELSKYGEYFHDKQIELEDPFNLQSHLLTPTQRLFRYLLLLKRLLKECEEENYPCAILEQAIEYVDSEIKKGNDIVAMDQVKGSNINIYEQGAVILRDRFTMWTTNRKNVFNAMVFLLKKCILITNIQTKNNTEIYQYVDHINIDDLGYTHLDYDMYEFKIWFRKLDKKVYTLRTDKKEVKKEWCKIIYSELWKQFEESKIRMRNNPRKKPKDETNSKKAKSQYIERPRKESTWLNSFFGHKTT